MPLVACLALAAMLLSGCRIDVTAELDLQADGSGTAVVDVELDRELMNLLDELELDPVTEVENAVAEVPEWEFEVHVERGDGLRLRLEHQGDDPAGALAELSDGLSPDDPGLLADLETTRTVHDDLELAGTIELAAPATPGAVDEEGQPIGPDAGELRARMAEHVGAALVVTMPGEVQSHDADAVGEDALRWELPVEERIEVHARSQPPPWPSEGLVIGLAVGLLLLVVIVLVMVWRRRRRRRQGVGTSFR